MTEQHSIAPPPELVRKLWNKFRHEPESDVEAAIAWNKVIAEAALWGWDQRNSEIQDAADAELEACCEWLEQNCGRWEIPASLRAARRPKPPSLKQDALAALHGIDDQGPTPEQIVTIRLALEALDD